MSKLFLRMHASSQVCRWKLLITFVPFSFGLVAESQTAIIDSLKRQLTMPGSDKLSTLFALCWQNESLPSDSFMVYALQAKRISIEKHDKNGELQSDFFIARRLNYAGMPDSVLKMITAAMKQIGDNKSSFRIYHELWWQKVVALTKLRRIEESLKECYQFLESAEKYNDVRSQVIALTNIGVNYNVLRNRDEARQYFNKAYHLTTDTSVYKNFPLLLINLAAYALIDNKPDSAELLVNKAFEYASANENLRGQADCFMLKAQLYSSQNKPDSAEQVLHRAVTIQKKLGYSQFILVGLDALRSLYGSQKNYAKAIEYVKQAELYSQQFHEPLSLSVYQDLAGYYQALGNYKSYAETMDTLTRLKDSLYQHSRAEDLARLEAQYQLSNKEAFIAKQKLELLHKNLWIGGIALATALILSIAYLLFRRNKRIHENAVRQAEENERKRIAADLHDNIGAYAAAISAGIDDMENKKLISDQSAIHHLKDNATEIITSLRNTIWALDKESINLTGIADRMKSYIAKMQPAYPSITIAIEESIEEERKFSPVQALNIFRIFQEALHNSLEHSQGTSIVINVTGDARTCSISIRDNGIGFDTATTSSTGNGLSNMRSRAAEVGFTLEINKVIPHGTLVSLMIRESRVA